MTRPPPSVIGAPTSVRSDPGAKLGDDLKLKQAYKLLMLQDLDNRYKMINRPR